MGWRLHLSKWAFFGLVSVMADQVGVRVRDRATGNIILDITDRLTRVIGVFNSGSAAGSLNVPAFAMGAGWAAVLEAQLPPSSPSTLYSYPIISISGTTLSWSFPNYQGQSITIIPCDIIYGVY